MPEKISSLLQISIKISTGLTERRTSKTKTPLAPAPGPRKGTHSLGEREKTREAHPKFSSNKSKFGNLVKYETPEGDLINSRSLNALRKDASLIARKIQRN
ncbi:hypothetical protein Peur_023163 [Populus x canadensis]